MRVLRSPSELQAGGRPVCVAIGVFDGLHRGHQAVLKQTLDHARASQAIAVAVTFDRHPNAVVAPERTPLLIQPLSRKLMGLAASGMEAVWLIEFDGAFSRVPADTFVRQLVAGFGHVRRLCVGRTFTFGYRRGGNLALLESLGQELGFAVDGLEAVLFHGQPISSTRIRDAIRAGELAETETMLGRPYSLAGRVMRGDQLGRQLGFPTANLDVSALILPPNGVYAARADLDGHWYPAVVNLGCRPTLEQVDPAVRAEAHLLDFSGDLHGRELEIVFQQRLREERKFASLEALREQIARDVAAARRILGESSP